MCVMQIKWAFRSGMCIDFPTMWALRWRAERNAVTYIFPRLDLFDKTGERTCFAGLMAACVECRKQ